VKSVKEMSMEELAAYVCTALENDGIDTVFENNLKKKNEHI